MRSIPFRLAPRSSWLPWIGAASLVAAVAPAAAQSGVQTAAAQDSTASAAAVQSAPTPLAKAQKKSFDRVLVAQNVAAPAGNAAAANSVAQAPAAQAGAPAQLQEVIVTGTREAGVTAENSAAPVTVLSSVALQHSGSDNIQQALQQTTPSFTVTSVGGDLANLTLSAQLRNLSPNDTLVLINGKRRHGTANLDLGNGGAAPDLSLIPQAAIDHIEVLTEGAAAQYGTDAIAGVINIILKHQTHGGQISLTGGQYYSGEGQNYDLSGFIAHSIGANGFVDVTLEKTFNNYTQTGGADSRLFNNFGQPISQPYTSALTGGPIASTLPGFNNSAGVNGVSGLPGYPDLNRIEGQSRKNLSTLLVNAGYHITPNIQIYDFGTYGTKYAQAYENWRPPNETVASPTLGVAGTYGTPGAIVPYPQGFSPQEVLSEEDYADTLGIKGTPGNWTWDLSSTYGKDSDAIYTDDSINRSLFIDTHFSPTNFYDGTLVSSELTNNLDITYTFNTHVPVTVAFGGEQRQDRYAILEGDAGSTYMEGSQSYPGFTANDVGSHSRTNAGGYLDIVVHPVQAWDVEAAGRAEHYSDFGSAKIEEFTTRYDFSPRFALRGTAQTGFRAPTIAEEYYTTTSVDPNYADVQLPADAAASRLLGLPPLQPEYSTGFSAGFVSEPMQDLHVTMDFYSIAIRGHIGSSPTLYCKGGAVNSPAVCAALIANGNVLDPTASEDEAKLLTNTTGTLTKGIDLTANYPTSFGRYGTVQWTLVGNYQKTRITRTPATPPQIAPLTYYTPVSLYNANSGYSPYTLKLIGLWTWGPKFSANLVENMSGPYTSLSQPENGPIIYTDYHGTAFWTDLEFDYQLNHAVRFAVGGRNIFNKIPPLSIGQPNGKLLPGSADDISDSLQSAAYGTSGGQYYARMQVTF